MIHWRWFQAALEKYRDFGFQYLEVPWIVDFPSVAATAPDPSLCLPGMQGYLVASAEQSFIQLLRNGDLRTGRYMALTPCFREEASYSDLVRPYFMKLELIMVGNIDRTGEIMEMAAAAISETIGVPDALLHRVPTGQGWDLELGGIEIGSYGFRRHDQHAWTYGTGLAEPRTSAALYRWNTL